MIPRDLLARVRGGTGELESQLLSCWEIAGQNADARAKCVNTYLDKFWVSRKRQ